MKKLIFIFALLIMGVGLSSGLIACSKKGGDSSNANPYYNYGYPNGNYAYPGGQNPNGMYPGYPQGYPNGYYPQRYFAGSCDLRLQGPGCPPGFQCVPMMGPFGVCQKMY